MARKHFEYFDALSSAVPIGTAYSAVIAVRRRDTEDSARVHDVGHGQQYDLASEAEAVAEAALSRVLDIDEEGGLIWESAAD